jgi:cytochrome c
MKNSKVQYRRADLLAAVVVLALLPEQAPSQTAVLSKEAIDTIWTVPNVGALPDDSDGRLVRRGRDLVTATYAYIGPEVRDRSKRYAAITLPVAIATLRQGRSDLACRSSASMTLFRATARGLALSSRSRSE